MGLLNDRAIKRIHCIGIGGIGVSGLAEILLQKGYQLSGSDVCNNKNVERLKSLGVTIYQDHQESHIDQADLVIYSSAIRQDNPEFVAARARRIPLIQRGKILAEFFNDAFGIAFAGTHGKTTTSALAGYLLSECGLDPTFIIGGVLNHIQKPAHLGFGKYFIAEVDESDASFLYIKPKIAIVTNVDSDHLGAYNDDIMKLKSSFVEFLSHIPDDGVAILCVDDPHVRSLLPEISSQKMTYGFSEDADIRIRSFSQQGLMSYFYIERSNHVNPLYVKLNLAGRHNASNAAGVVALADFVDLPDKDILRALRKFPGVGRRFFYHGEMKVRDGKALLFEDYGHHPNEIKATLEAARAVWPDRRLILVFQPHRYSRTKDLLSEFANVLSGADINLLLLLEVYSAGEDKIVGGDGVALLHAIIDCGKIQPIFVSRLNKLSNVLHDIAQANDVIFFLGAGSIGPYAQTLVEK